MRKYALLVFLIIAACFVNSAYSQQNNTTNTTVEKFTSPKGREWVVVKKARITNPQLHVRQTPGNTDEYRKANGVPADFPKFVDTGNPKTDADNYHNAKQEWIATHPKEFEKIKHLSL